MKDKLTKVVSLAMVVAIIISMAMPFASAANKVTKCNVAATAVEGNADNKPFPKGLSEIRVNLNPFAKRQYTRPTVYFNFQVDSSQKVKWVEAYVRYIQNNKPKTGFVKVAPRYTAKNFMRYASFSYEVSWQNVGTTMEYYFVMQDTKGSRPVESKHKYTDVVGYLAW